MTSDTVFRLEGDTMLYIECGKCDGAVFGVVRGFRPEIKQHRKGLIDKSNEKGLLYLKDYCRPSCKFTGSPSGYS